MQKKHTETKGSYTHSTVVLIVRRTELIYHGHYSYPDYEPMAFWGDSGKLSCELKNI